MNKFKDIGAWIIVGIVVVIIVAFGAVLMMWTLAMLCLSAVVLLIRHTFGAPFVVYSNAKGVKVRLGEIRRFKFYKDPK